MRVAETTDVSGRVTADDVNLERIHYSFRKVCNNFNGVQNDAAKLPTKIGPNKLAFF